MQLGVMIAYGVISNEFSSFSYTWIATLIATSQRIYDQAATVVVMGCTWRKVKAIQDEWKQAQPGAEAIKP